MTLPSLFLAVVLVAAMMACLSLGLLWRSKMGLQLRLDRCVEKTASDLETLQNRIEAANLQMNLIRAAAVAAAVPTAGGSLRAAKAALLVEKIFQEAQRMKWKATQASWVLLRGCDSKNDAIYPLPEMEWWRPPDDGIGAMPLQWKGPKERGLGIRIWKSNRFSAAKVAYGLVERNRKWGARWVPFWK